MSSSGLSGGNYPALLRRGNTAYDEGSTRTLRPWWGLRTFWLFLANYGSLLPSKFARKETDVAEITDLREKCARCSHAWSFHGKAFGKTCRAMGCKGSDDGTRCAGFVRAKESASLSTSS